MILEHKDERKYATWKLEGKFYELSFTAEDGKIQNTWLSLKARSERTSYATPNTLGSITINELDDLQEVIEKAQQIIEDEGLLVKSVNAEGEEMKEITDELRDLNERA